MNLFFFSSESHLNSSDDSLYSVNSSSSGGSGNYSGRGSSPQPCHGGSLYHSHSNPDLTSLQPSDELRLEFPEHVLKVYRSDQTCKYLLIHKVKLKLSIKLVVHLYVIIYVFWGEGREWEIVTVKHQRFHSTGDWVFYNYLWIK